MENCNREELLKKIMQYKFTINDLALYLDTHNNDKKTSYQTMKNSKTSTCEDPETEYKKTYKPKKEQKE